MAQINEFHIDEQTINKLGLQLSEKVINAQIAPNARVFEYPHLDNVFIMENDLYGNVMPSDFCFLAFYGQHGLIGKPIEVEVLNKASVEDISNMVQRNNES